MSDASHPPNQLGLDLRTTGLYSFFSEFSSRGADIPVLQSPAIDLNPENLPAIRQSDLNVDSLIHQVHVILETADRDQSTITLRYIEAGRLLRETKSKCAHGQFENSLERWFPNRSLSTLREYMTLAKGFDAADEAAKLQLVGLFKHGWKSVLEGLRELKRAARRENRNGRPLEGDANGDDLRILRGDCLSKLRELPDESVDCGITSPPYFQCLIFPGVLTEFGGDSCCEHDWEMRRSVRRDYEHRDNVTENGTCRKCGAQRVMLGWEDTVAEYIEHMVKVFAEVRRVIKPSGVLWLNVADKYSDKGLLSIPERLVVALADHGWIYRAPVIWHIPNRAPETVNDRPTRSHENVYMFAKEKDYYFDAAAIREPAVSAVPRARRRVTHHGAYRPTVDIASFPSNAAGGWRNKRSVWLIPHEPFGGDHFCPFPKTLIEPMVLSSCPKGGVCLDPFAGTGTTGLVALAHGRKAILIDGSEKYCGMAKHRIDTELEQYKAKVENRRNTESSGIAE